jgi:hypothetical protein
MISGVGFQEATPARGSGGKQPRTVEKALAAAYAEYQGALLVVDGDGNYAACGADPALVAAVAATRGGTDSSGFNILGHYEFPPGYMQGISTADGQQFLAPVVNGPLAGVAGQDSYGVTRDTDGVWKVDGNKLNVNPVVKFQGYPDRSPADAAGSGQDTLVLVTFLPAVVQEL